MVWARGDVVSLAGIASRPELNGTAVRVVARFSSTDRYGVELVSGEQINVRASAVIAVPLGSVAPPVASVPIAAVPIAAVPIEADLQACQIGTGPPGATVRGMLYDKVPVATHDEDANRLERSKQEAFDATPNVIEPCPAQLSDEEKARLRCVGQWGDANDWAAACSSIKQAHGGVFADDWHKLLIEGKLWASEPEHANAPAPRPDPLSQEDKERLRCLGQWGSRGGRVAWANACASIKQAHGGIYPTDWHEMVIQGGLWPERPNIPATYTVTTPENDQDPCQAPGPWETDHAETDSLETDPLETFATRSGRAAESTRHLTEMLRRKSVESNEFYECQTCGAHRAQGYRCCGRYLGLNGESPVAARNVNSHPDADKDEVQNFLQSTLARLNRERWR